MADRATPHISTSTLISSGGASLSRTTTANSTRQEITINELTDNGVGGFGAYGTVNYAGKTVTVRFVDPSTTSESYTSDHEKDSTEGLLTTTAKGGAYGTASASEVMLAANSVTVSYARDFDVTVVQKHSFSPPAVTIDLCPYTSDYILPGSVQFTWMGHVFTDHGGALVRDRTPTDAGFLAGQIDYGMGIATISDYLVDGPVTDFVLDSCWTLRQNWTTASIFMRTQASPVKPSGFVMNLSDTQGNEILAQGDIDGIIAGPHLKGAIDYETGIVELQFGDYLIDANLSEEQKAEWWYSADEVGLVVAGKIWRPWPVDPSTLRYNSVTYFYLPLDAALLGIDPVRLPPDGRVAIFRAGSFAVVGHTGKIGPVAVSNGQVLNCARTRLSRVRVLDAGGAVLNLGYSANLEAGTVTFSDVSTYAQPVTVEHRIEDMAQVSDVQINGTLTFSRSLTHDYPVPGSYVSSALISADLKARVSTVFDQGSWDGIAWKDVVDGNAATGTFNDTLAPMVVTNVGATTERWAIWFKSSTTFEVIGEHVGVIATGTTGIDCAPINPATGSPYLTLPYLGWGSGWSVGNVLRINTVGAVFPVWLLRTVQQGPEAGLDYNFTVLTRGDVNRP
ncbi:MAG: hypothetical protein JWP93_277 [Polaromonas sp.]|nr:hypothetical protein [Polaromonas sp.]